MVTPKRVRVTPDEEYRRCSVGVVGGKSLADLMLRVLQRRVTADHDCSRRHGCINDCEQARQKSNLQPWANSTSSLATTSSVDYRRDVAPPSPSSSPRVAFVPHDGAERPVLVKDDNRSL